MMLLLIAVLWVGGSFEARRDLVLERQVENPFPSPACKEGLVPEDRCVWGKLDFALASLWLKRDAQAANRAIRESCARIPKVPGYKRQPRTVDAAYDFHFITAALLTRIHELFGKSLEADTKRAIEDVFYDYARSQCKLEDAAPAGVWRIWGSENHSAMRNGACWGAARILRKRSGLKYDDGSTPAAQYRAWTAYLKLYIRERAKRGMLVEIFSPGYYVDTLQNFHNYYDFSDDAELRRLSRAFLDLWWADWAQEQINGVHGGSKARFYPTAGAAGTPGEGLAWLYFGMGEMSGRTQGPALMNMLTSGYRIPEVVADIALDVKGRGVYAAKSRRPGRAAKPWANDWYDLDAENGGIYRYTYCTPSFIMGASMFAKLHDDAWTHISDQNRWQGVILDAGPEARIFALPEAPTRARAYNQVWCLQSAAAQIVQKLPPPLSRGSGRMRVWFGGGLRRVEQGGWVFVDSAAYVAVRPAFGGYTWDAAEPRWMLPEQDLAPVIIQAAQKSDYPSFEAFQAAVGKTPLAVSGGVLRYSGLGGAGRLTFYYESDRLPEIDGKTIDLRPNFTFRSPFVNERWASGVVTVSKGPHRLVLDFSR